MAAVLLIMNNETVLPMGNCFGSLNENIFYYSQVQNLYSVSSPLSGVESLSAVKIKFHRHEIGPLSTCTCSMERHDPAVRVCVHRNNTNVKQGHQAWNYSTQQSFCSQSAP